MPKKTKPETQPNPAIAALSEILPTLDVVELIKTMSYVFQEVKKRYDAE